MATPSVYVRFQQDTGNDSADVNEAAYERSEQAGWLALCELRGEISKCSSVQDVDAWVDRVNARALEIFQRVN